MRANGFLMATAMAVVGALGIAGGPAGARAATQAAPRPVDAAAPSLIEETSIDTLAAAMREGRASAESIAAAYLARIDAIDRRGPTLRSVVAVNPDALADARALDAERRAGRVRGPLHGIPVLVKDNIETRELPTTAGSLALKDNRTGRDAPIVARLRAAGAIILGKTNLSEWANIRSSDSMSGWSAVGGLVRNPHALDRTACGSSSGSGAAAAASLAAVTIGTETDGSIVCPAAVNGVVGLKPTVGLLSRTHIVPISHSQDTAGPMARSVKDAAILFSAMIGADAADAATRDADRHRRDHAAGLSANGLRGVRVGVLRPEMPAAIAERYEAALRQLRAAGAVLVDVKRPVLDGLGEAEFTVLKTELKADLNAYLATTPPSVKTRTLADVIAFNKANGDAEMRFFGQDIFEDAQKLPGLDDPAYRDARAKSLRLAGAEGIDALLRAARAALLVSPTAGRAWLSDPVHGDNFGGPSASGLPAVAGYPHLTVPMGLASGLPVGLSFIGPAYSEALLLNAGHAYEQRAKARVRPGYAPTVPTAGGLEAAG